MSLEELICKQEVAAEIILKSTINYKKTALAKRTKGFVTERLSDIKKLWVDYTKNHFSISQLARPLKPEQIEKYSYLKDDAYSDMESEYFEFVGLLRDTLSSFDAPASFSMQESLANSTAITHEQNSSSLKLPRITLPKFSGSYESWRSFHDLFNSLVHKNSSLAPVQKLHYLKASVTGEADHLLRQFSMTDASYESAWKVLLDRYNNKRILVNAQLKTLCNLPKISNDSSKSIKNLLDRSSECIFELEALEVSTENWDPILVHILVQCLSVETHRLWEQEINKKTELPKFSELKEFLERRFRTLEAISENKSSSISHHKGKALIHFTSSSEKCLLCKETHQLYRCPKFINLNINDRYKVVNSHSVCVNCLSKNHKTKICPSKFSCKRCGKKHHSLLHKFVHPNPATNANKPTSEQTNSSLSPSVSKDAMEKPLQSLYTKQTQRSVQALLSTSLVSIYSKSGAIHTLRALVDSGSQVSFITKEAARKLRLATSQITMQITGLGKTEATKVKEQATLEIHPQGSLNNSMTVTALVVQTITDLLPPSTISVKNWNHIKNLHLADPFFNKPGKIDLLLGADVYGEIILEGLRKGPPGTPTAQNSILGWILFGKFQEISTQHTASSLTIHAEISEENSLDNMLKKFWETEEVQTEHKFSKTELECERFYEKTHRRSSNGRYEVRLPFLNREKPNLGESRNIALRRFYGLEKRLTQNPDLYSEYRKGIHEYRAMGFMKQIEREGIRNHHCYLPHHPVIKDSTSTKVRIVVDPSTKTTNGKSLNEQLHPGPVLQSELFSILLRWRKYPYAMSSDIRKMYLMIDMHQEDQNYQRVVWRDNTNEAIKDVVLTTVTFGTTSAPYLAIRTLHQLAKDEAERFPKAAEILVRDFYVDDLMSGADTLSEALEIQQQLIGILNSGGFALRKWLSNSSELLRNIPEEHRELKVPLRLASDESVKTLGIHWFPASDYFTLQYRQTTDTV